VSSPSASRALVRWLRGNSAVLWIAVVGLAFAGGRALVVLPSGIYPEMTFPRVMVVARVAQLAPDLMEAQVTRPLEEVLAVVPGVRHIRAKTIRGGAELSLQLTDDADPLEAQYACRAAVDRAQLPRGATTVVERVLPTAVPVITFDLAAVRGRRVDPRRLRELGERVVRPAFVRVAGVGGVEVQGGRVREVELVIDPAKLAALHLTPSQLADRLERADQRLAAGRVLDEYQALPIVLDAEAPDLGALRQLPIALGAAGPIPLSAVAEVVEGAEDPDVIVRGPSGEAVALSVSRLPGASTPEVVAGILAQVAALHASRALPPDVELTPVYDQAQLVDESLTSVRDAILLGIALSLIVIALALRDWRAGLVAALPVPLTLLGTFAVMRWFGIGLNLMSLGGLAIAIGLVVDDAIVVTDGIVARLEEGLPKDEAIERGFADMFAAVVGTTATTIVVFAPLALLTGMTGAFLGAFAATLAIAVALSMILALALIPILAGWLRAQRARQASDVAVGAAARRDRFDRGLGWLLRHRWISIAAAALLLGVGYVSQRGLSTGFLPAMDEGAFVIDFHAPSGTSLEETDRIGEAIDAVLRDQPAVVTFTRRTGAELGPAVATLQNEGDIMVRLVPRDRRGSVEEVIEEVRGALEQAVPEARFEYVQVLQDVLADLAGNPEPIELRALGDDLVALEAWAAKAGAALAEREELVDVFDGREGSIPGLRARIQPTQLARLGLDAAAVGADLIVAAEGRVVAEILQPARAVGVRLRYPDEIRTSAAALARSPIAYGADAAGAAGTLSLDQVVAFDRPLAPSVLRRDGLRPALVLTASTPSGDLGAAAAAIDEVVRALPPPRGTQLELGGQAATSAAARHELLVVAAAALVLVLIVLLVQLHSLRYALVVLLAAPLSAAGGLLALALTDTPLDLSSLTGLILLVGLVVKNGILLIEQLQRELAAGLAFEPALIAAARRRLRPILMTTVATLAGLAPLAIGIGAGAELQRPLAIAVIGGLVLATAVTLVVMPGLASLVTKTETRRAADLSSALTRAEEQVR
jgi:multidrug efflux pump subunit AcrB